MPHVSNSYIEDGSCQGFPQLIIDIETLDCGVQVTF